MIMYFGEINNSQDIRMHAIRCSEIFAPHLPKVSVYFNKEELRIFSLDHKHNSMLHNSTVI